MLNINKHETNLMCSVWLNNSEDIKQENVLNGQNVSCVLLGQVYKVIGIVSLKENSGIAHH